jgi:hypothetical protein
VLLDGRLPLACEVLCASRWFVTDAGYGFVEEEDGYAQLSCAFERVVESRCGNDDFDVFFKDF